MATLHETEENSATATRRANQATDGDLPMALSLGWKLVRQLVIALVTYGLSFFLTAGTLRYWEGWAFLAILFIPGVFFSLYFLKRDPELVRHRLETREKVKTQKWIIKIARAIFAFAFLIPALDFRFGWTRRWFGGVPLWLRICLARTGTRCLPVCDLGHGCKSLCG
jgi:hypothetical protein